jgi:class 3 adenylate cyclase
VTVCAKCGQDNPEGFRFCPACASPLIAEPPAREMRKTVTAVFCDVVGSTTLGERLDPEVLRSVMARYFDVMRGAVEGHGGTVSKFIGDAVGGVFGVHQLQEDDPMGAVRAAAEMRTPLVNLNAGRRGDSEGHTSRGADSRCGGHRRAPGMAHRPCEARLRCRSRLARCA